MKFLLIIILFFSLTTLLFSQSTFQLAIGINSDDMANSIIRTTDGGYAAAGNTGEDFYIVKLDSIGSIQWTRTVRETNMDGAYSIIQTTSGGYAVAGSTVIFAGDTFHMYIVNSMQTVLSNGIKLLEEQVLKKLIP